MELASEITVFSLCLLLTQTVILMVLSSETRGDDYQINDPQKELPDMGQIIIEHTDHKRVKRSSGAEEFFQDEQNQATYIVLPVLVLVYGGCSSIYCIYKCRKYFKRKHSKQFKDTPSDVKSVDLNAAERSNEKTELANGDYHQNTFKMMNILSMTKPKSRQSEDQFIEDIEMVPLDDLITMEENFHGNNSQEIEKLGKSEKTGSEVKIQNSSGFLHSKNISPVNEMNRTGTPVSKMSEIFVVTEESSYSGFLGSINVPHMPDIIPADDENSKLIIKRKKACAKVYSA